MKRDLSRGKLRRLVAQADSDIAAGRLLDLP